MQLRRQFLFGGILCLAIIPSISFAFSVHQTALTRATSAATLPTTTHLSSTTVDDGSHEPSTSVQFAMDPDSDEAMAILNRLELSTAQQKQLKDLARLVVEWNERINLISRKDCSVDVVFGRHVMPCLGYLGLSVVDGTVRRIIDVGTGGGFPGLPLAIAYPEIDFWLVDSVGKKLGAVENMAERLGLTNVKIHHGRAEELVEKEPFDICVGRSVAALPKFCFWVKNLIDSKGKLAYMIGGEIEEDVLQRTSADVEIDELLEHAGVSDKRILVFPKDQVTALAKSTGMKLTLPKKQKNSNNRGANASKGKRKPKGAWSKRDASAPKQRGYDDFQRYDSSQSW